jgi:hypothetical protein
MEGAASSNRTGTNSGVRGRNLDVNASQNRQLARTKCGCFGFCGFVHGCPALAKRRRRRHRDLQATSTQYASPLSNTTQCAADLAAITAALIQLPPKLSTPCQALLAAPRTVYCHKAVPCGIDHVSVWNAMNNSQVVSHFPTSGGMLCARDKQTLAAEVNYEPDRVYCTLTGGPRSDMKFVNTEYGEPFFLHTKYGSDIRGMYFEPGNYTLRMVGDNGTQPLTVTFGVTNQC